MAVLVEGISVIIKASTIVDKYPDGWEGFKANVPNNTLCADGELVRIGFMNPSDVKVFIESLEDYGIIYQKDNSSNDLVVVDQLHGFASKCDWAEFGKIDFNNDPNKKVSACRIIGSKIKQIVTPDGWDYDKSLSKNFRFIDNEEIYEKVVFLRSEGETDVYLDIENGKEVYIVRTSH